MKLKKLNDTLLIKEISFINGGQNSVKPSKRWDSGSKDTIKGDHHPNDDPWKKQINNV
jgi:hypothetical protein